MIQFSLPGLELNDKFKKIHSSLKTDGILGDYLPRFNFPDEPQFFQYMCERKSNLPYVRRGYGYGSSENKDEAITAAIAEAVEHYCLLHEQEKLFVKDSYKNLGAKAVDPTSFEAFTKKQLEQKEFKKFRFDKNTEFNWIKGYSYPEEKEVLIPAQLVYANYTRTQKREPIIQVPISTGAACGPDFYFALYRGLCEIVERDNYMITYLSKIKANIIDLKTDSDLAVFEKRIERYNLQLFCVDTALDFDFNSVVSIICDPTGIGPAVSIGLGGSLDPARAIISSGLEAVRRHIASRDRYFHQGPLPAPQKGSTDWYNDQKLRLWSAPHMIETIRPFISGRKKAFEKLTNFSKPANKDNVSFIVKQLKQKGCRIFIADITIPQVEAVGLKVLKVIIPELLPLFHDERYPYEGNNRLINSLRGKKLDPSHPF
ncbi:MAG: YcaO-like family protein [Candidatus Curtissbacteria bacterium]